MKIQRFKMGFSPSVKGCYIAIIGLFFSTVLSAQYNTRWELGIALKPLSWTDEPYCFMAKRFLSPNYAIRFGLGGVFKQRSKSIDYVSASSIYRLFYSYTKVSNNIDIHGLLGIQYGKKFNNIYLYGATDLIGGYNIEKNSIPHGIIYPDVVLLVPNQFIEIAYLNNSKILNYGFSQSLGIQYFINSNYSISLESSIRYKRLRIKTGDNSFFVESDNNAVVSYGYSSYAINKFLDYTLYLNPLTSLIINYHF